MNGYSEITTQQDMDALLDSIAGFHDSMTKEVHLVNRGYVLPDHSMLMNFRFDARVLIQSQWEPYGIEILFVGIEKISAEEPAEYWGASGSVVAQRQLVEKQAVDMKFDDNLHIRSERLFWRVRPDWLGPGARFGQEIPSPDAIPAMRLEEDWRQCSNCSNAWEANPHEEFAHCPQCGTLTELQTSEQRV